MQALSFLSRKPDLLGQCYKHCFDKTTISRRQKSTAFETPLESSNWATFSQSAWSLLLGSLDWWSSAQSTGAALSNSSNKCLSSLTKIKCTQLHLLLHSPNRRGETFPQIFKTHTPDKQHKMDNNKNIPVLKYFRFLLDLLISFLGEILAHIRGTQNMLCHNKALSVQKIRPATSESRLNEREWGHPFSCCSQQHPGYTIPWNCHQAERYRDAHKNLWPQGLCTLLRPI